MDHAYGPRADARAEMDVARGTGTLEDLKLMAVPR